MKRKTLTFVPALLVAIVVALAIFSPASAQAPRLNVKLGLWEATSMVQTSGAPPVDMSKLTPEQRTRLETMMANMQKRPHTFKTCLTEEKLSKTPFADERDNRSCKETAVTSSATEYDAKFTCEDSDGGTNSGEWHFVATTPELVTGNVHMTMEKAGRKMESANTITAKWIAAACGNVR